MGFAKPPAPPSVGMPPPAAHPSVLGSSVSSALSGQKARADSQKFTADDTIGTSPQGLKTPATTAKTTLLGQ